MMRYIVGFVVLIALIVLVVILIFSGGGSKQVTKPIDVRQYANSSTARAQLIIDGPVNGDAVHNQVEIDVTQSQVAFTAYTGYQRQILRTKEYDNNGNAFASFIYGLYRANIANGTPDQPSNDYRGFCVTGDRYQYTVNDGDKDVIRWWLTSCGQGTFKGDAQATFYLFSSQVPDYDSLVNGLNI